MKAISVAVLLLVLSGFAFSQVIGPIVATVPQPLQVAQPLTVTVAQPLPVAMSGVKNHIDFDNPSDVTAKLIPTQSEDVLTSTAFLREITLTNETSGTISCIITDRQAQPRSIYGSAARPAEIPPGAIFGMTFRERRAENGIRWSCSGSGISAAIAYFPYVP